MKTLGVWAAVIIISLFFLCIGKLEHSKNTLFIGAVGVSSGIICGILNLIVFFIKSKS